MSPQSHASNWSTAVVVAAITLVAMGAESLAVDLEKGNQTSRSQADAIRSIESPEDDAGSSKKLADAIPPRERLVSLTAEQMPLEDALTEICRQADMTLQLDSIATAVTGLKPDQKVNIDFRDRPLSDALGRLINWRAYPGLIYDIQGGKLLLTTLTARAERIRENLPPWLKLLYEHGLLASVDEDGNVVTISAGRPTTDDLLERLTSLPKLRELCVGSSTSITPAGLAHLADLPALEKLELHSVNVGGAGLGDAVLESVRGLKTLKKLTLGECGTTDAGVKFLEDMTQLTHLTLRQEGRLTDRALSSIAKLKGLKYLDLSSYVGTVEGVRRLAALDNLEFLGLTGHAFPADVFELPQLRSLSLGGAQIDDAVADWIAQCKEMNSLSLGYTRVSDAGLKQIATLSKLRKLSLDSHFITDMGIGHLTRLPHLQHIELRASHVSDATLKHLSEIKTLTRIDLSGSGNPGVSIGRNFTEAGYIHLANLPNLQTLWLNNADVRWTELTELVQLRELHLIMPTMSHDDVRSLQESLPDTYVSAAWGGSSIAPDGRRGR